VSVAPRMFAIDRHFELRSGAKNFEVIFHPSVHVFNFLVERVKANVPGILTVVMSTPTKPQECAYERKDHKGYRPW